MNLQEEKEKERRLAEEMERIEAIGAPGKKGSKEARSFFKEQEKQYQKEEQEKKERLHSAKNYRQMLAELLRSELLSVDWPSGWRYSVFPTKEGVVLTMSKENRHFRAAFRPTGEERYDLNAVKMYALRAENTIDRVSGKDQIIIP